MSALVEMDSSTSEISRYQLDEIIDALEEEILQGGDDSRIESLDSSIVSVTESQSSYFDNLGDDSQTDTTDNRSEEISQEASFDNTDEKDHLDMKLVEANLKKLDHIFLKYRLRFEKFENLVLENTGKHNAKIPKSSASKHITCLERIIHYFRRSIQISHLVQESLLKVQNESHNSDDYTRGLESKILQIENENHSIMRDLDQLIAEDREKQRQLAD